MISGSHPVTSSCSFPNRVIQGGTAGTPIEWSAVQGTGGTEVYNAAKLNKNQIQHPRVIPLKEESLQVTRLTTQTQFLKISHSAKKFRKVTDWKLVFFSNRKTIKSQ